MIHFICQDSSFVSTARLEPSYEGFKLATTNDTSQPLSSISSFAARHWGHDCRMIPINDPEMLCFVDFQHFIDLITKTVKQDVFLQIDTRSYHSLMTINHEDNQAVRQLLDERRKNILYFDSRDLCLEAKGWLLDSGYERNDFFVSDRNIVFREDDLTAIVKLKYAPACR